MISNLAKKENSTFKMCKDQRQKFS